MNVKENIERVAAALLKLYAAELLGTCPAWGHLDVRRALARFGYSADEISRALEALEIEG